MQASPKVSAKMSQQTGGPRRVDGVALATGLKAWEPGEAMVFILV